MKTDMFGQLFVKECRQMARSLIYWIVVVIMIFDFVTQLGGSEIAREPQKGQEEYGIHQSDDPEVIMRNTLGNLAEEYYQGHYTTYPIGFAKTVTPDEKEEERIGEILEEATGLDKDGIGKIMKEYYSVNSIAATGMPLEPAESMTYDRFRELMDEVDDILGGGSNYGEQYLAGNGMEPMTYEDALEEYHLLVEKDRLSGGYARLFSDYMVIFMGILPVFLAATRELRDRRAQMQELIYTRRVKSMTIIGSRYLSIIVMLLIPLFLLSLMPLAECIKAAAAEGIRVDYLAYVKYILGWILPTVMIVTAVGMFLTDLTDTAVAVLVQGAWWFVSAFTGVQGIDGGAYGWNLMPRHNTELNYKGFHDGFSRLASNRILYASLAIVLVMLTAWMYSQKRRGRLNIRGKILADRKSKSKA